MAFIFIPPRKQEEPEPRKPLESLPANPTAKLGSDELKKLNEAVIKAGIEPLDENALKILVVTALNAGKDVRTIAAMVVEKNWMTQEEAPKKIAEEVQRIKETAEREQFEWSAFMPGLIAGVVAAAVSGLAWGAAAVWTGWKIGFAPIGVGMIVGVAVEYAAGKRKGLPLQFASGACAALGILFGMYYRFVALFTASLGQDMGDAMAARISWMSGWPMIEIFFGHFFQYVRTWDYLWIALGVYVAWQWLAGVGLKRDADQTSPLS